MLTGNTRGRAPWFHFGLGLGTRWLGSVDQLDPRFEHAHEFPQRQSNGHADIPHLNQIKPALTALHIADEGLCTPKLSGEIGLRETRPDPEVSKQLDQNLCFLAVERFGHGRHLHCAALKLDMLFRYIKIRYLRRRSLNTVSLRRSLRSGGALAVLAGIGLICTTNVSAKSEPKPEEPEAGQVLILGKDQPAWYVSVDQGLDAPVFKSGIMAFLDKGKRHRFHTKHGVYRAQWLVDGEQNDWFLVPATQFRDGEELPPVRGSGGSSCRSDFSYHLAVRADTGAVAPYEYTLFEFKCANGEYSFKGRWDMPLAAGIRGTATIMNQSQWDAERSRTQFRQFLAEDERQVREEHLAPQKRKIGTKICKQQGATVFIGFTEAVSPDIDRIQIRVVAATNGPPRYVQDSSFREQVLWDNPVNWSLCDASGDITK